MTGTVRSVFWGDDGDRLDRPADADGIGVRAARAAKAVLRRLSSVRIMTSGAPPDRWPPDRDAA